MCARWCSCEEGDERNVSANEVSIREDVIRDPIRRIAATGFLVDLVGDALAAGFASVFLSAPERVVTELERLLAGTGPASSKSSSFSGQNEAAVYEASVVLFERVGNAIAFSRATAPSGRVSERDTDGSAHIDVVVGSEGYPLVVNGNPVATGRIELTRAAEDRRQSVAVFSDGNEKCDDVYCALDPLSGDATLVTVRPVPPQRPESVALLDEATRSRCPFCPERIEAMATFLPSYLRQFIDSSDGLPGAEVVDGPGGSFKIRYGDCWALANIAGYDEPSILIIAGEKHVYDIEAMPDETLVRALRRGVGVLGALWRPGARVGALSPYLFRYPFLAWNFLPASGGSLLHPHLQLILSAAPGAYLGAMIDRSRARALETGSDLFSDLWDRKLKHFQICEDVIDYACVWPAPRGVLGEVAIFFPRARHLSDLSASDIRSLAAVIKKAMRAIRDRFGGYSFNLGFLTPRFAGDVVPVQARLVFRIYNSPTLDSPDATFFDYVYRLPVSYVSFEGLREIIEGAS
jgi:galactose-1-phosphate uridylyltransferase